MSIFTGSGVAIVTPFNETGIDYAAFESLIDFQLQEGTDAIVVCGTTGEPSTMSREEKQSAIQFVVDKVKKRVPVIAGTGGNNTRTVIEDSIRAEAIGADALLVVTPYYNKTNFKGLIEHYYAVADAVNIPIIVYNVPARTGLNVTPAAFKELIKHPNIQGMKEASGDISQVIEIARLSEDRIDLYSGNDDIILPVLAVGGKGVISVVANIAPKDTHDLVAKFMNGDIAGSRQLQFKLNPLIEAIFIEVSPIPIKTALNLLGFRAGKLRPPLTTMSEHNLEILKQQLIDYGFTIK